MKRMVCMISVVLAGVSTVSAGDWWHWRGPWQSGVSPEKDLPSSFSLDPKEPDNNLVWKAPYPCRSTPLVMNGRVFLLNNTGREITEQERVLCLDADTGKLIWEYKFNVWHTDIVSSRLGWTNLAGDPATGNVYAHGTQGMLLCLNKDGKVVWQRSLTEEFGRGSGYGGRIVTPTVADDMVIMGMLNGSWGDQAKGSNRFVAFNKRTGEVVWWNDAAPDFKDSYYSSPVVAVIGEQKQLISGCGDGTVVGINLHTGKLLWRYQLGSAMVNAAPVVQGDFVFAGHGEENPIGAKRGAVVCLNAAEITDGKPKEVWRNEGVKVRYASPIVDGDRVYFPEDIGKLFCFDAKTGKQLWSFLYGRNARGSPVMGDGKIYVGDVFATFHILKPGPKKCERLFQTEIFSTGKFDIEINGTPAIANGRVYFCTSEETYCLGTPEGRKGSAKVVLPKELVKATGKAATLALYPADITLHAGDKASFSVRAFDAFGSPVKVAGDVEWSLPTPPMPPGAKAAPPPLKGGIASGGMLTVEPKVASQQGYVEAKWGGLTARARVRVAPRVPYAQDFDKIPDGAAPGGWVGAQGKFLVKSLPDGNKVLAKVTNNPSPPVARNNTYIGLPTDTDYTIQADVMGGKVEQIVEGKKDRVLPEIGVVANRYTLLLVGNLQKLRIVSWDALPRVDRTIPFEWKEDVWYTMKLTVDAKGSKGVIRGKVWPKGQPEPDKWTIETDDPVPTTEGAPALYGYVLGIPDGGNGTDIFYDNVKITPNGK